MWVIKFRDGTYYDGDGAWEASQKDATRFHSRAEACEAFKKCCALEGSRIMRLKPRPSWKIIVDADYDIVCGWAGPEEPIELEPGERLITVVERK